MAQEYVTISNNVNKCGNSLLLEGNISFKTCQIIIDTGASRSIIRPDLLSSKTPITSKFFTLKTANGQMIETLGEVKLHMCIGNCKFWNTFIVARITDECIIGLDFLKKYNVTLDLQLNVMKYKKWEFPLYVGEVVYGKVNVLLNEDVILPPNSECGIKVQHSSTLPCTLIIEAGENVLPEGLLVARTIVKIEPKGTALVRVANFSPHERKLKKSCVVGVGTPVLAIVQNNGKDQNHSIPKEVVDLLNNLSDDLTKKEKNEVKELLKNYSDIFTSSSSDYGRTKLVKHEINTGDNKPIKLPPRRLPLAKRLEAQNIIENMKNDGVIEYSNSPWCSPVVLVKKKDGSLRFCVDYRSLNSVTEKDSYPLPRIDDTFDALSGSVLFSTLDLKSGYWQVEMNRNSKHKTAFSIGNGLWQFNVMPFGLCNAPATFERLMESVLRGLNWETCLVYLDDVIIFGRTFDEHKNRLEEVFKRFRNANLKLAPKKCQLFQNKVRYLGHIVTKNGVAADPDKVDKIKSWPIPKNKDQLRSFLGLCTYYRKFVKNFAETASCLHKLASEKCRNWSLGEKELEAFEKLKYYLSNTAVLSFPLPNKQFILDTDASNNGIGAVLSQNINGAEQVISYYSRKFSKPELNYCVTRKELLAIVDAVKHFHKYLYGSKFLIRTDHAALKWLLNFKNPEGQIARWIERLQTYDFEIQHRPGRNHLNADALSRRPCDRDCKHCLNNETKEGSTCRIALLSGILWSNQNIQTQQKSDCHISPILAWVQSGQRPSKEEISSCSRKTKMLWVQWDSLILENDILKRRWEAVDGKSSKLQVIVPSSMKEDILSEMHGGVSGGHMGINRTLNKIKEYFYWPDMRADVENAISRCDRCEAAKGPQRKSRAHLQQYLVGAPNERIAIDVAGPFPTSMSGNKYILVVMDYFTKWVEVFPIPNQEAVTVAEVIVNNWISRFGIPLELHSDQGRNFESLLFKEMCSLMSIRKTRTTPLHPQSDGMVERFNRTIESFLVKVINKDQSVWDKHIPMFLLAYRTSVHESTGKTPSEMMFGYNVRLPSELLFGSPPSTSKTITEYGGQLRKRLEETHENARDKLKLTSDRMKHNYDISSTLRVFNEQDLVWLYNPQRTLKVSPKLTPKWEGPYTVIKKLNDVVYRIRKSPKTKFKVVHIDRLATYRGNNFDS